LPIYQEVSEKRRIISHSYAGITRIRFNGYDLSLFFKAPLIYSAKLIVQSSKRGIFGK